jgi:hypothetical protein
MIVQHITGSPVPAVEPIDVYCRSVVIADLLPACPFSTLLLPVLSFFLFVEE